MIAVFFCILCVPKKNNMEYSEFKAKVDYLLTVEQRKYSQKDKGDIETLAKIVGYSVPDCGCVDKWNDLVIRLALFCKNHPAGFPAYEIDRGVIYRKKPNNELISYATLTNELAEWALENEPEAKKHIRKIGNVETAEAVETETETEDENVSRETSTKKRTYNKKSK